MKIELRKRGPRGEPGESIGSTDGTAKSDNIFELNPPLENVRRGHYFLCIEGYEPDAYRILKTSEVIYSIRLSTLPPKKAA